MANFCLPKEELNRFLKAIDDGVLDPANMVRMSSVERRAAFSEIVGENLGKKLNVEYEAKLILKDQQRGIGRWYESVKKDVPDHIKRDLVSTIERYSELLEGSERRFFLEDLVERRLGFKVTHENATAIMRETRLVEEAREKIVPGEKGEPMRTGIYDNAGNEIMMTPRQLYGMRTQILEEYVRYLKKEDITVADWLTSPDKILEATAGTMKSIVASLDNSFFGRQGLKVAFSGKEGLGIWSRAFAKSWKDIFNELAGKKIRTGIKDKNGKEIEIDYGTAIVKSDILSRDNALNGKYDAGKFDLSVRFEEAYPSALPKEIPGLRRLYNASEAAFNGAALRMRADLADAYIRKAEAQGIDMMNKENAVPIGRLVNSMTGRGHIWEQGAKTTNILFFSIRFLKSNFDVLAAPFKLGFMEGASRLGGKQYSPGEVFARRKAAANTVKIAAGIAATLWIAEQFFPGSVEKDPRSTDFGKIKINNTRFDVSGGMGSMTVLAMRLIPTKSNGEWGMWSKSGKGKMSATTRIIRDKEGNLAFAAPERYGQRDSTDVLTDYLLGKASPALNVPLTIWAGRTYDGEEVTAQRLLANSGLPITVQNYYDLQDPEAAPMLAAMISDALGIGTNTY